MSSAITIAVIVLLAAGVYGFVRTARFGTSFITKPSGVKAADIYDRYEVAAARSREST
jgi:hypothetical protein